jgi:acid phosphatase
MRRLISWLAGALALVVATAALGAQAKPPPHGQRQAFRGEPRSKKLGKVKHIVVIYEENHSFDNLYGRWEGVNGLRHADRSHRVQVKQDGSEFNCLPQNDVNLSSNPPDPAGPLSKQCDDSVNGHDASSHFFNQHRRRRTNDGNPFRIDGYIHPEDTTCPKESATPPPRNDFGIKQGEGDPGGCTRDLEHRFYQEQYQINGGRQNRYTMGSDALGLTQGVYDTKNLPIYKYLHEPGHPRYSISDAFFQAAHGGSYLNHRWLIAASTGRYPGADPSLHSIVDENGMPVTDTNKGYFYKSPAAAVKDAALTAACADDNANQEHPTTDAHGNVCGDWAVNTIQPASQPYAPGTAPAARLPLQTDPTIGDRLNEAHRSWAWYSGGWSNADGRVGEPGWTNGNGPACSDPDTHPGANANATYPFCPNAKFQFHHQPFNYFAQFSRDTQQHAANREEHLRDEQEFIADAKASKKECKLRDVSFVKPIGAENEHPGYASEPDGSNHLVDLLKTIHGSACRKDTMVVVTYDEFGGQWDHASPPGTDGNPGPHDAWGPGTRIPALTLAPGLRRGFTVDHTQHDTTSILATIEHRFGLDPVSSRDAQTRDMSSVFSAGTAYGRRRR